MEFRYARGQKLVIELTNGQEFEGDCEKCAKDRIDLINIVEYPKRNKLKGILSYYRCEIGSVRILDQENEKETQQVPLHEESQVPPSKTIALLQDEYDRLKNMTKNYIYVEQCSERFTKATDYLKNCENIGVYGVIKKKRIILLVLASWEEVYIFDLLLCGENDFPLPFKTILQSAQIKKVLHNSRAIFDCLWHSYKVKLNNIFDTYVADVMLQECKSQKPRSFVECLRHYLNFPNTYLEHVEDVNLKEWTKRPLDESYRIKAAQLVTYLITLKNKQEKILLKDYYDTVAACSQTLVNSDGFMAQKLVNLGDTVPEDVANLL